MISKDSPAPVPYSIVMPLRKCKFFDKMVPCPNKYLEHIIGYFGTGAKDLVITDCWHCKRDLTNDTLRMRETIREMHINGLPTLFPLVEI
jgi:hypothetical protein